MNQSEFLAITCNLLQVRETSHVQDAIGLGSHWLKTWRRCFQSITKRGNHMITVEPLLSGPPSSGHPLLNDHISKSRKFCNTNTINYPSIKRSTLLSGRGHTKSSPK